MNTLGLDLGTNSLGWAIVDEEKRKIIDSGVRIFPEGIQPDTIGSGDKEKSKNESRRESRQRRRHYYRKRLRKIKLLETLIRYNMCPLTYEELKLWKNWNPKEKSEGRKFPDSKEFNDWLKLNPYELRAKALYEDVSLIEFGRILYHLIQRRGFLSSRKDKDTGAIYKGDDEKAGINETLEKKGDKTLGEFLNEIRPKDNQPFSLITDNDGKEERVRARYTLRKMYIEEFERIWQRQKDNLGLEGKTATYTKTRYLEGKAKSSRNAFKIDYLRNTKGKKNVHANEVNIDGATMTEIKTKEEIPLKEFLGGRIWWEDGEMKFKSNESVLFWQRPLRSQKSLLSKCSIESRDFYDKEKKEWITIGPTPSPISHPDFERFRAWKFVNTVDIASVKSDPLKSTLTDEQREKIYEVINQKQKKKFPEIPKKLELTFDKFNYSDDTYLPHNKTISQLKPLFDEETWNKHYHGIWHCFYFYDDNDKLFEKITRDYGAKIESPDELDKIKLEDGYAGVSLKAIRNILPFLEKGYKESTAVVLGGVKNAFGDRWEYFKTTHNEMEYRIVKILRNPENKEGEAIEKIKKYLSEKENGFSFEKNDKAFNKLYHHSQQVTDKVNHDKIPEIENLRNPIVQHAVNELRRLVNELIDKYGLFEHIHVEMGRDLKAGKAKRQEITNQINDNRKKNDEAREKLTEFGLRHTRDNIQKYLLFTEIQGKAGNVVCPYTNKSISPSALLGPENAFQIEHIIPRSISLDDSFANKTLCDAKFNQLKGEKTPYQFYKENSDPNLWGGAKSWEEVAYRAFRVLPYGKAKRFTAKKDFESTDFIQRQLNDTRYISKKAKEILSRICDDVRVMPGSVTSELRHLWGLNNVLQPVKDVKLNLKTHDKEAVPHYAVLDENNKVKYALPVYNDLPQAAEDELTITGYVDKEKKFKSKYLKFSTSAGELDAGAYWAKLKINNHPQLIKRYIDRPETDEDHIALLGQVNKEKFRHNSLTKTLPAVGLDGSKKYYATFKVLDKELEPAETSKRPKAKKDELLLYGQVNGGRFKSYIYQCKTNLPDDAYWLKLKLDIEDVEFIPSENPKPEIDQNKQILITASVDNEGKLSTHVDKRYSIQKTNEPGIYWCVFDIKESPYGFTKVKNDPPKISGDEKLVEGNIWVDKYGEIRFDPKKNREDQRHHAIDAITVALAKQSYLQQLSTYYAQKDEQNRGNGAEKPQFHKPWDGFRDDVEKSVSTILIPYPKRTLTLKKVIRKIIKDGYKRRSESWAVRGEIHEKTFYGKASNIDNELKRKRVEIKKLKFKSTQGKAVYIKDIIDESLKEQILKQIRISLNDDSKTVFDRIISLEKDADSSVKKQKEITKLKSEIEDEVLNILKTKQFYRPNEGKRYKRIGKSVDIAERSPVPIRKVKVWKRLSEARVLKEKPLQYANPGENHHVLIYKDENGKLNEDIVTLWMAVERKLNNIPIYTLPEARKVDNVPKQIIEVLQKNDMFLLGLTERDLENYINNKEFLSHYLYRVQTLSSGDYYFRHHLASTLNNENEKINIKNFGSGKTGWYTYNPIKVKIDRLGNISQA